MKAFIDFIVHNGRRIQVAPEVVEVTPISGRRNWYRTANGEPFKCVFARHDSEARKAGAKLVALR